MCNPVGDPIPGPRTLPLVEMCDFPWKQTVDAVEIVKSVDAYRLSMSLSQEGLICGPSSGMNLKGLYKFLQNAKQNGELHKYADPNTREISCVFVCCDLPYQYLDGYFARLEEEDFPSVTNQVHDLSLRLLITDTDKSQNLLNVDTDEYDGRWELGAQDAMTLLYGKDWNEKKHLLSIIVPNGVTYESPISPFSSSSITVVDLRSSKDFADSHIRGAFNTPLANLTATTPSPFDHVNVLQNQWKDLKTKYTDEELNQILKGSCLVICYNGETSRLATAVMRAQGTQAYSVRGGMPKVQNL